MDVSVPAMSSLHTSFAFQPTQVSPFCPSLLPLFAILRIAEKFPAILNMKSDPMQNRMGMLTCWA
jgi:hypothetical protein